MAVAFDAVGPDANGANATSSPLSWTHTLVSGTNSVVCVWAVLDAGTDTGYTLSATCGGTPMNPVQTAHSNNTNAGFGTLFQLTGLTSGGKAVVVTAGGTGTGLDVLAGGSISFTGASQTAPLGTPGTITYGTTANATCTLSSNTNGNIALGVVVDSSRPTAATGGTFRWTSPTNSSQAGAAGYSSGISIPTTGSPVVMTWTSPADWYAAFAVEILPPSGAAITGGKVRTVQQAVQRASLW